MEPYISDLGTIRFTPCTHRTVPCFGNTKPTATATASPAIGGWKDIRRFQGFDLYAFENNGSVAWEYFAGQPISSSAALGQDGTIYFGDENGTFHAVNPDGSNKWTFEVEETTDSNRSILSSPALDLSGKPLLWFRKRILLFHFR